MKTKHSNQLGAWTLGLIVGSGLLAVLWSADGFGSADGLAAEPANLPTWNDYKIVDDQNMFSKNRRPLRTYVPRPVVEVNELSLYILRGITAEDGKFVIFLQDNQHGGVLQKHVGDDLLHGKIKAVAGLDAIEYQVGETTRTIQMGYDLQGTKGAINILDLPNWRGAGGDMRGGMPGGDMRGGMPPGDMRGGDTRNARTRQQTGGGGRQQGNMQFGGGRRGGMGMQSYQSDRVTSSTSTSSSDTVLTGDDAEILRRLMERRQQELGQTPQAQALRDALQQPQQGAQPQAQQDTQQDNQQGNQQ